MKHLQRKKDESKGIAKERMEILFAQAQHADDHFAKRYITLARKIGMKYKVRLTPQQRRFFCHACNARITTAMTRIKNKVRIIHCPCGEIARYPLKPKVPK